jgi:hypothetical protein
MYKIIKNGYDELICINHTDNKSFIPIDSANIDYQQFKKDLANGVELKDATGNVMTSQAVTEFLQGLQ